MSLRAAHETQLQIWQECEEQLAAVYQADKVENLTSNPGRESEIERLEGECEATRLEARRLRNTLTHRLEAMRETRLDMLGALYRALKTHIDQGAATGLSREPVQNSSALTMRNELEKVHHAREEELHAWGQREHALVETQQALEAQFQMRLSEEACARNQLEGRVLELNSSLVWTSSRDV